MNGRPLNTLSAKCIIRITDVDDSTLNAVSGQFRIKPYILTRFKPNGDYEAFDPAIHGWSFADLFEYVARGVVKSI